MDTVLDWNGKLDVPHALLLDHDEVRIGLVRARLVGGPITETSERLAQLCLPHFEYEEQSVFPVLALLPHLTPANLRIEMMGAMPLISEFNAKHEALARDHQSIQDALLALLRTAHKLKNREVAKLAYRLRIHERIEDEVIYPTVVLIGHYLQEKFSNQ